MKKKTISEEDEFILPTNVEDCTVIIDRLWYEFFCPEETPSSSTRKAILERYNLVVKQANKLAGMQRHISLTSSTRWNAAKDDTGPESKEPQFVAVKQFKAAPSSLQTAKAKEPALLTRTGRVATVTDKPVKTSGKGGSIIEQIIALHIEGFSNKEIIAKGFNKSTVGRQVGEYKKKQLKK